MAKPDCDDGWLKYAHELDAALAVADFTKGARVVLREVFAQIFGPAKLRSAALSPTDIGTRVGMRREHVARAVKELADANALVRLKDGSYRFNKDYESWLHNGSPRLTPGEVAYCRNAPAQALSHRNDPGNASSESRNDSGNTSTEQRNSSGTDRNSSGNKNVPELVRSESPPCTPLLGSLRLKEAAAPHTNGHQNGATLPATPEGPPDPAMCPPYPDPARDLIEVHSGPHALTDPEARDIFARVWRLTGAARACHDFYARQRSHSAATWRAAISEAAKRGVSVASVGYLHRIAGDIEAGRTKPARAAPRREPEPKPEVFDAKKALENW